MSEIHPTAIVEGDVELADGVEIGPHCVVRGSVRIGAGTRLIGNVYLEGPLRIGARNLVYPFTTLGFAAQHLEWDPAKPGAGLEIGDDNTFRESVSISRATSDEPTRVGNGTFFMANSHAGHDAQVGDRCVLANGALVGGEVTLGAGVIIGGNGAVHQHCQVGRGAMVGGMAGATRDVPPFFLVTGISVASSVNVVGMRRSGMDRRDIDDVKWVYKTLYRRELPLKQAVEELRTRADRPIIAEYLEFLAGSKRGVCTNRPDPRR